MEQGEHFDLAVIGGGINGAGIARDAAGRGLKVLLVERDDLAGHTSSSSTKLIHGGLRYLEYYHFRLVRKALMEREVLLAAAPHIIWPLRFVMPHDKGQRPEWMIRAGLFLYDHLARREQLPASETVRLARHPAGVPLNPGFGKGFVYSDGWVDDARLVVLNALDAAERGASVRTRTACVGAQRAADGWSLQLESADGAHSAATARAVVNATGPWVGEVLGGVLGLPSSKTVRLVKGSHIIVRKLFDHPFAYIFQNPDGRIIFAIPYEGDYTLIGTTDVEYTGDAAAVAIDAGEIDYLCSMANRYFARSIGPVDVVWRYSGVRPLLEDESADASSVTRDYNLELNRDGAPLLSVFGGKITTFRVLAEEAMGLLAPLIGGSGAWTAREPLPGGDMPEGFDRWLAGFCRGYPWLPAELARRLARAYGTRVHAIVGRARSPADLGAEILPGVFEAELKYLCEREWALSAEDILWRRSKLGLHMPLGAEQALQDWLAARAASSPPFTGRAAAAVDLDFANASAEPATGTTPPAGSPAPASPGQVLERGGNHLPAAAQASGAAPANKEKGLSWR